MVEVRYNAVDMNATKKLYGSSNESYTNEISDVQPTGGIEKLTTYENVANYISFDGLGIDLYDDNSKFYEDGDFVGALSSNVSDENGNYSGFDMTVEINTADFLANGKSVSIEFVGGSCSYCDARLYEVENGVVKPDTPVKPYIEHKYAVFSSKNQNVANFVFEKIPTTEVCWVTFIPTKTTHPHSFIKIQRVLVGNVEVLSGVKDINITEEINILGEDLPMNELDCSILSKSPLNFAEQNPLTVYSNGKFFGSFYADDVIRQNEDLYSIIAFSSISKLNEPLNLWAQFSNGCNEVLKYIMFDVSYDAGGYPQIGEKEKISIISEKDISTSWFHGYMGGETKRKILCASAWALNMWVDNSRKDTVHLRNYPTAIVSKIEENRIIGNAEFEKKEKIKSVSYPVGKPRNSGNSITKEIGGMGWDNAFEYKWGDDAPAQFEKAINILPYYYDLYGFRGQTWSSDPNGTDQGFVLTYKKISFSRDENVLLNDNLETGEKKELTTFNLCASNSYFEDQNAIFFDKSEIAQKYMNSRGTAKAKIRLRDEKIGDMVTIPTAWDGEVTGMITYMNINFGYEDVADIEITEWSI